MPSRTSARPRRCPIDKSSTIRRERSRQRSSQIKISRERSRQRSSPIKMAPPPPPPRSLPPELVDDVIGEILLRLPPDDPACLVRASLSCKRWRSIVSDRAFSSTSTAPSTAGHPPVLGFFHNDQDYQSSIFVPTATMPATQPVPQPSAALRSARISYRHTLDCRHGRVLFETKVIEGAPLLLSTLTVWDPLTGNHQCFDPPLDVEPSWFVGAVLCAAANDGSCDHLECSGGPFHVVLAGVSHDGEYDIEGRFAWARVYSSETSVWGPRATIDVDSTVHRDLPCSLLVGGAIHFMLGLGESILKYDMVGGALSVMEAPPQPQDGLQDGEPNVIVFATARDGERGAATLEGYCLHLWSWSSEMADGVGEWTRVRVIELGAMIQLSIGYPATELELAAFAQGAGLIFISVNGDDMFTVDIKSGHVSKTGKRGYYGNIFPLVSFCTPDRVSAGLQAVPMMID